MFVLLFLGRISYFLEAKFCTIRMNTLKFQIHVINIKKLNELCPNESDVISKALDVHRRTHEKNATLVSCIVSLYSKTTLSSLTWRRL